MSPTRVATASPNYDKTISIIDLKTFTEVKKVDVAINLHRLELDNYGKDLGYPPVGTTIMFPRRSSSRPQDRAGDEDA